MFHQSFLCRSSLQEEHDVLSLLWQAEAVGSLLSQVGPKTVLCDLWVIAGVTHTYIKMDSNTVILTVSSCNTGIKPFHPETDTSKPKCRSTTASISKSTQTHMRRLFFLKVNKNKTLTVITHLICYKSELNVHRVMSRWADILTRIEIFILLKNFGEYINISWSLNLT